MSWLIELWDSGAIRTPQWMWVLGYSCSLITAATLFVEGRKRGWKFRFWYLSQVHHYLYVWGWAFFIAVGWEMPSNVSCLALSITSILVPVGTLYGFLSKDRL